MPNGAGTMNPNMPPIGENNMIGIDSTRPPGTGCACRAPSRPSTCLRGAVSHHLVRRRARLGSVMAVVDMARLDGVGRRFGHRIADVVGN